MSSQFKNNRKFHLHLEGLELLEEGIDLQTQIEYIEHSHSFDRGELTREQIVNLGNMLSDSQLPSEGKKKVLSLLAHTDNIAAFKQIEKYYNNPDKEIKQWAALALQESKIFLESSLTQEMTCFVSSGLGGNKNRMRYYFLVLPLEGKLFSEKQKAVIKDEFTIVAKNLGSEIESFDFSDTYAGITVLLPLDIAPETFFKSGMMKCNELGEFVLEYYYVTNTDIPDQPEIEKIIRIILDN
ncbi:MAG: hypothetical protein ACM3P1_05315 [Candidatus Saccharibacteria bacterium]